MLRRRLALLALTLTTCSVALAEDIVIESRREGKNYDKYSEGAGRWQDSNTPPETAKSGAPDLTPQGQCGSRKLLMPNPNSGDAKQIVASAKWSPKLAQPGHYHVYITFSKAGNVTPANYVVKHAKGEETISMAMDGWGGSGPANSNRWISLGDYDFNAGDDQFVELRIGGDAGAAYGGTPAQAMADGALFSTEAKPDALPRPTGAAAPQTVNVPAPTPAAGAASTQAAPPPAAAAPPQVPDAGPLNWETDIRAAQQAASGSGKKIFAFFYSPGNERSRNYDGKVFTDPKVKQVLKQKFVLARINIDENRALASNLQVFRAGTINIYDDKGLGVTQITETLDAGELASRLEGM